VPLQQVVLGFSPTALFEKNPHIGMMYHTWDKKPDTEKEKLLAQAAIYRKNLESL
jgi:deoxyribodipyrimidine photolyase-like uncharacterized protein